MSAIISVRIVDDILIFLEKLTETFPEWKVLHKYWRTDRHFNTFYPAASSVDGVESETGAADGSANMHIDPPVERDNEPRIRTRGWSRGHTSAGGVINQFLFFLSCRLLKEICLERIQLLFWKTRLLLQLLKQPWKTEMQCMY